MTKDKDKDCLSVVVPIYNEAEHLAERVFLFVESLNQLLDCQQWELLLINNGSRDKTAAIISDIKDKIPNVSSLYFPKPNYGFAIHQGVNHALNPWIYIVDLDQWDNPFLQWSWRYRYEYQLIISSKRADPSINKQSRFRFILSWGLNAALQILFAFPGSDTHGQKLFNRQDLKEILKHIRADRGQFDVEFVVRTLRSGKSVIELPVPYIEMRPPRNTILIKILWNSWALSKLAWRLRGMTYSSVELRRVSRSDVTNGRGYIG